MLGHIESPKRARDVKEMNPVEALDALESEPVYEELGGRMLKFGPYEATKMGHETIISDANGHSVTVPTRKIEERLS